VFAQVKVPGFHHWPDAPPPVEFLRARHRHLFHIMVMATVGHDERAVEFIYLSHLILQALRSLYVAPADPELAGAFEFGARSCETIAIDLANQLALCGVSVRAIEVNEDDENGAMIEFQPGRRA
jgi:hypothetical protein